jgi:uncharacterized MAPEG superfamily protein
MTYELTILVWAIVLGFVQLILSSHASLTVRGVAWAAGPRDTPGVTLTGIPGRLERAFKNFLETFPFFAAAILICHVTNTHGEATLWGARIYLLARILYVPAYVVSVPTLRSALWFVSVAGMFMVLFAPMF